MGQQKTTKSDRTADWSRYRGHAQLEPARQDAPQRGHDCALAPG